MFSLKLKSVRGPEPQKKYLKLGFIRVTIFSKNKSLCVISEILTKVSRSFLLSSLSAERGERQEGLLAPGPGRCVILGGGRQQDDGKQQQEQHAQQEPWQVSECIHLIHLLWQSRYLENY